jgi:lipopolysaccharide heptosyltransferase II
MSEAWGRVRRLLCVRLDSLGDVLMTTPAIRAFKQTLGCSVTLLTSAAGAAAVPFIPEIDDCIRFAAPWMKSPDVNAAADLAMIEEIAAGRFDAAAIFTVYSQNPLPAAYLCYLAGIPRRLGYCRENPYRLLTHWLPDPEPAQLIRHEVERQLVLAAAAGCRTKDERLSFRVPAAALRTIRALELPRPLVVVHPGASAASRRYPPESFASAMSLLIAGNGAKVVFTGDAQERLLVERIRGLVAGETRSLAGKLSVGELGALIAEADLLVSNNTGPAHIAAAVGTPVVDLYALTNPQHTPWQVENRVLFHDVPCRNCYKSICPHGHHDCLRKVAPERVAAAASELLRVTA